MNLRSELIALAQADVDRGSLCDTSLGLVLGAARLALEAAARECEKSAAKMFHIAAEECRDNNWGEGEECRNIGAHEQQLAEIIRSLAATLNL